MAAVMMQVIPRFKQTFQKKGFFISTTTYEKYIVTKEYSVARHVDKLWFLHIFRNHILLTGDIGELRQKLVDFLSHVNTWTVSIHFSSTVSAERRLPRVDKCSIMCKEQSTLTDETREWTKWPVLQKKLLTKT